MRPHGQLPDFPLSKKRKQRPAINPLINQFLDSMVSNGSVTVNTRTGILSACQKTFKLSPSEARIVAVFINQSNKEERYFSAKTASEILGYGSASSFRSRLVQLRDKLSDFCIANYGGFSDWNPHTIYADSLLLSDCSGEDKGYFFNEALAHSVNGKHVLSDALLENIQIQVHPKDSRFFTGMALFGDRPNKPALV